MPYSPIPKFPIIIRDLNKSGFSLEVPFNELKISIMKITGSFKSNTIKEIIQAMISLGYIKESITLGFLEMMQNGKPYNFLSEKQENVAAEVDNILKRREKSERKAH